MDNCWQKQMLARKDHLVSLLSLEQKGQQDAEIVVSLTAFNTADDG